jgi:hypothetical protein
MMGMLGTGKLNLNSAPEAAPVIRVIQWLSPRR